MHDSSVKYQHLRTLLLLNIGVWFAVLLVAFHVNGLTAPLTAVLPTDLLPADATDDAPSAVAATNSEPTAHANITPTASHTPTREPTATPLATATSGTEEQTKSGLATHLVRPGDTIYGIARTYEVDVGQLIRLNSLSNPNFIESGQEILLPATATPVPSEPATATPTPTEEALAEATPTEPPTPEPTVTLQPVWPYGPYTQQNPLPIPPRLISVLLLGAEGTSHWRTDSIMLVMFNPDTQRAGMLSLPRDLWVAIPGYGYGRINTVDFLAERTDYPGGGPALLRRVLRENLGVSFDHYVRVHFDGFIQIVDTLGGVDVVVDCAIEDLFPHPTKPGETLYMNLQPGVAHLDGAMALSYSRSRLSTSDFDRAHRQQSVIEGLWRKGRQLDIIPRIPQLYRDLNEAFVTDLDPNKVVQLARAGLSVEPQNIQSLVVNAELTNSWRTPEGAAVLLPNQQKIEQALTEFFTELSQPPSQVSVGETTVRVQNQTGNENWEAVAGSRVEWSGGIVSDVVSNPQQNSQTRIVVYRENTEMLEDLLEATQLDESRVERHTPDEGSPDMEIVIGQDFNLCIR